GVRYTDSIDKSGEYRQWVVRALNTDLPYDQFLKLQVAGDLFPADPSTAPDRLHSSGASLDGITATGMLAHAVWEQVGRDLAVAEIVDSQIDLVGRQLLGLTLACARCHDHKFDPISTQDYYALAGILFSSHIATGELIADARLGNTLVERPLLNVEQEARNKQLDESAAQTEAQIAEVVKKVPQAARLADLTTQLADLEEKLGKATATGKKPIADQIAKAKAEHEKLVADQQTAGWDRNPPELQEIANLRKQVAELKKQKLVAPVVACIVEGGVPGSNREKIGDAPVYLRGEYQREGAIVPRRFPVILAGEQQTPVSQRTTQSGRRELAEWLTSTDNPLTARVMVNRLWQHMVGRGLVRSPDNFGRLGEPPTHPELLDHLSTRSMASGWSMKRALRDIALSATFRQSSFVDADVARLDPENRLLSRMNRRRLAYEELRDSLLKLKAEGVLAAGDASGGTASGGAKSGAAEASAVSATPKAKTGVRRTLYEPIDRRKVDLTAALFDGPDSKSIVPVRAESTTAPQALFLMNNSLVVDTAKELAARLKQDPTLADDQRRVERLWLLATGRPPEPDEVQLATAFVSRHSWERFVQAVLGMNEFCYLD
ncbi:MAG TPA: DUF1553 domain-containing protein, partial [Pirellulaceae bacterium]|nr:DUF1553 domain-containing protein [Pirellulaceae bacterium]